VSSPSTLQNPLNQQKTKEKKLLSKWHSSYVPPDKIEAVEKTRETPAARRGFSCPKSKPGGNHLFSYS
jgi:hypothetical protein